MASNWTFSTNCSGCPLQSRIRRIIPKSSFWCTSLSRFTLPWNKSCMKEPNRLWPNHLNIDVVFLVWDINFKTLNIWLKSNLFCVCQRKKNNQRQKWIEKKSSKLSFFDYILGKKFFRSVQVYILLLHINYNANLLVSDIILPKSIYLINDSRICL